MAEFDPSFATPSIEMTAGEIKVPYENPQKTHFSVVDKWGNAVSNTYILYFGFGTGLMAEGIGILLNNGMDEFSSKLGVPNTYVLVNVLDPIGSG